MARFYGTVQGARGQASRLGHATSSLVTEACSWQGKVIVHLSALGETDLVHIRAEQHGSSRNPTGVVFSGTFEELRQAIDFWNSRDQLAAVLALSN
jgi:hypothetical protein